MGRVAVLAVAVLAAISAATVASGRTDTRGTAQATCAGAASSLPTLNPGTLTVGTDNPAYPPWFGGTPHSPWKVSDPNSGKGYESAVAYAVADYLGFAHGDVTWVYTPFNKAFAPGKKSFDFDINEISYTPARAK